MKERVHLVYLTVLLCLSDNMPRLGQYLETLSISTGFRDVINGEWYPNIILDVTRHARDWTERAVLFYDVSYQKQRAAVNGHSFDVIS